jgi:hypothetical protein
MRENPVGKRIDVPPIPPLPDHTHYLEAGALRVGIEYRVLDNDIAIEHFNRVGHTEVSDGLKARPENEGVNDRGISLHVCEAATGQEYLRFDVFDVDPHYHYVSPGSHQVIVGYDTAAGDDFLEWSFRAIATRIVPMLEECGATALAAQVDQSALEAALPQIRTAVTKALQDQATIS